MNYIIRPLGPWLEPVTENRRGAHLFRASWADTLGLLGSETDLLGAEQVILQIDVTEGDLRRDGMLRANARVGFPGVRVSFDSTHGPLTYATDAYERQHGYGLTSWQANIRAVALALEALRAVDRYGVSGRGQQYTGWTALDSKPAEMTPERAAKFIADLAGDPARFTAAAVLADKEVRARAYKAAAWQIHPGRGGDEGVLSDLNVARQLLDRLDGGA